MPRRNSCHVQRVSRVKEQARLSADFLIAHSERGSRVKGQSFRMTRRVPEFCASLYDRDQCADWLVLILCCRTALMPPPSRVPVDANMIAYFIPPVRDQRKKISGKSHRATLPPEKTTAFRMEWVKATLSEKIWYNKKMRRRVFWTAGWPEKQSELSSAKNGRGGPPAGMRRVFFALSIWREMLYSGFGHKDNSGA